MMFEDVAGPMADMKCNYIGSATLLENVDGLCMAPGVAAMVAEADDTDMREVLRDLGIGRSFRRDMYRRGLAPLSMAEHQDVLETIEVAAVGSALPADMSFSGPRGKIAPNGTLHKDIFEAVAAAPISLAKLHRQVDRKSTRLNSSH